MRTLTSDQTGSCRDPAGPGLGESGQPVLGLLEGIAVSILRDERSVQLGIGLGVLPRCWQAGSFAHSNQLSELFLVLLIANSSTTNSLATFPTERNRTRETTITLNLTTPMDSRPSRLQISASSAQSASYSFGSPTEVRAQLADVRASPNCICIVLSAANNVVTEDCVCRANHPQPPQNTTTAFTAMRTTVNELTGREGTKVCCHYRFSPPPTQAASTATTTILAPSHSSTIVRYTEQEHIHHTISTSTPPQAHCFRFQRYGYLPSAILAPFPASLTRHPGLWGNKDSSSTRLHPPLAIPALHPPFHHSLPLTTPANLKSSRAIRSYAIQFPRRTLKSAKTCLPFPPPAARHSRLPPAVASFLSPLCAFLTQVYSELSLPHHPIPAQDTQISQKPADRTKSVLIICTHSPRSLNKLNPLSFGITRADKRAIPYPEMSESTGARLFAL
ncbi:hypothetical protein BD410DRAFT_801204 [Rickenella mellea]|uniref:Uncharacterized protein n=1 Tax=Rickenella mellea TaxID=50990 RepID=A0A4Y7QCY5_9AGAM|nr:hypothetical protein BD410DRAFT_801204 [Rickenella mellea]